MGLECYRSNPALPQQGKMPLHNIIVYIPLSKLFILWKNWGPIIEPINVRQYEFKQSKYPMADKLSCRSIVVSASQGGKGILIENLILNIYRGCFEIIYLISSTAYIAYKEVDNQMQSKWVESR